MSAAANRSVRGTGEAVPMHPRVVGHPTVPQSKNTGGDPNSLMVSLRNSFDEAYLDTLCEIEWRMSKENLTEDFLWQWIKSEVETFKNQTMPDIEGLFQKELKFGTGSNDVKSQVFDYFHSCNTIIRTNGLASLFNGNDEKKCKILVKCLPEKLKKRVKNEIDFGKDGNPKRNVPALYQLTLRMALEQAKEDQRNGGKGGGARSRGEAHGSKDGDENDGCYGCGGNHSLMNCTKLSKNAKSKNGSLSCSSNEDDDDTKDDPPVAGARDDEKIRKAIEDMVQRAIEEGFHVAMIERLRTVISMYDIWRVKLGDDPPARVEPLKVRLKKNAVPYKSKARKYSPELQRFLEDFNEQLVNLGWVYENPNSRWACPALPVRKAGGEYRQTTDYKPTNLQVEPLAGLMPNLDVDFERVMGCVCLGLFDFIKGHWQLPLDEESQEILSYMTHRKIYTPRRVPQGCSDAALYFQSTMERCFASLLYEHLLVWIDDLLLYAKDVDTYLDKLQELFGLVDRFGFKLSATKSSVYKKEVKWCGRIINGDGSYGNYAYLLVLKDDATHFCELVPCDKVDIRDWTYYVPVLQASLKHTPVPSLGHHAPVEVFCVLPAISPLVFVLDKRQKKLVDIGLHSDHIKSKLETLQKAFEVTEEVREHIAGQGTVMTVDKLLEHRWHKGKKDFELLVAWKGLEPIENSWETLASLYKDIPNTSDISIQSIHKQQEILQLLCYQEIKRETVPHAFNDDKSIEAIVFAGVWLSGRLEPLPSCRTATTLALCGGDVRVVVSLIDPHLTALHAMVLFKSWTFLSDTGSLDLSSGYLEIDDTVGPEQPETTPVILPENVWEKLLQECDAVDTIHLTNYGLLSVSSNGQILRLWDIADGALLWDSTPHKTSTFGGLNVLWVREEALANIKDVQWITPAESEIEKQPMKGIPTFMEELEIEADREVVATSRQRDGAVIDSSVTITGDDSLLLKYLNPHMFGLATIAMENFEGGHKSTSVLYVSLIDAVSGRIIHRVRHMHGSEPVRMIQSLGVTVTSRGITPPYILVGMENGQIYKLPRGMINPRQPDKAPTQQELEEGLIQYTPLVPMHNNLNFMITYNQTIANVKAISTTPVELESTTLVFAHGLDLFYVRLAPANAFDVLPPDFNYELLVLLCLGFFGANVLAKHLAQRKALNEAWK
ncbi:hypothetical protein ATCC90586_007076 [Pythium insidiosum]|nr:hypothetical protein ATCC90586_007076 [Pythium insidiosum]